MEPEEIVKAAFASAAKSQREGTGLYLEKCPNCGVGVAVADVIKDSIYGSPCPECASESKNVFCRNADHMLQHRRFYHAGKANYEPEAYSKAK